MKKHRQDLNIHNLFATKEDLATLRTELKTDFALFRGEVKTDFAVFRGEVKTQMASLKGDLEVKIADVRSDVIRWMFAFFVTMLGAIIGLYFKK